jgi:hypothetical protein
VSSSPSKLVTGVGVALACLSVAQATQADPGIPAALGASVVSDSPLSFVVASSFGILVSRPGREEWEWTCDDGMDVTGPRLYRFSSAGPVMIYGLSGGAITVSRDHGCNWEVLFETDADVVAIESDRVVASRLWLVTRHRWPSHNRYTLLHIDGVGAAETVFETDDFEIVGVDGAASDVVLAAWARQSSESVVYRSSDGGTTWAGRVLVEAQGNRANILPRASGLPNELHIRVMDVQTDRILRSVDGGDSFQELVALPGFLRGYAASGDRIYFGSTVALAGTLIDVSRTDYGVVRKVSLPVAPQALAVSGERTFVLNAGVEAPGPLLAIGPQGETQSLLRLENLRPRTQCGAWHRCLAHCTQLEAYGYLERGFCASQVTAPGNAVRTDRIDVSADSTAGCTVGGRKRVADWGCLFVFGWLLPLIRRLRSLRARTRECVTVETGAEAEAPVPDVPA